MKQFITGVILLLSTFSFAQNFQGKAIYQSKTSVDMSQFGGADMPEDRKKMIAERMKSMLEKTFVLTFDKVQSIYKEDEKLDAPGSGGRSMMRGMMSSFTAGAQYKNNKTKAFLQDQEFFGKQFLITDKLPELVWKMETETKQIGQYLCFKATTIKKVDDMDWRSMRRPKKGSENEEALPEPPKEITVTAWYTMQIPVSQGPGEYSGLPGLILEINADRTTILCTKITLNPTEKEIIKVPTKGKVVTKEAYNAIVKKKMKELRDMYGGRGKRGHGRRH